MDLFLELLGFRQVIKYKSLRLVSIIGRSPVVSLIPRSVVPSVVDPDSVMLVPVLGPPWAVWFTTPTWFTAGLAIGTLLVVELAVLSRSWAAALRIISTDREWLVMRSYSLSCGAFHLILGACVEPIPGFRSISTDRCCPIAGWGRAV